MLIYMSKKSFLTFNIFCRISLPSTCVTSFNIKSIIAEVSKCCKSKSTQC